MFLAPSRRKEATKCPPMNPPAPHTTTTSFFIERMHPGKLNYRYVSTKCSEDIQLLVRSKVNIFPRVQTAVAPRAHTDDTEQHVASKFLPALGLLILWFILC